MREKAQLQQPTFALTADVKEAHRQVPVHPSDWRFLGCQVKRGETVYVNTVGTFGISSASYYWSGVAAAAGHLAQYLAGDKSATWHMLVADDFLLEAGDQDYRFALVSFFVLCAVVGMPLSWNKTAGGETVTWVGFELLHGTRQLGISSRRAEWIVQWTAEVAASSTVHLRSFEEGLGRVMYVAGALEYERRFLAPLWSGRSLPTSRPFSVSSHTSFVLPDTTTAQPSSTRIRCHPESTHSPASSARESEARSPGATAAGTWTRCRLSGFRWRSEKRTGRGSFRKARSQRG